MSTASYQRGDWVIYRKTKCSTHPGPRARNVAPTPKGDDYIYNVEKFWIVLDVLPDQTLLVVTRRRKEHICKPNDPNLRRATWLERFLNRQRFEEIETMLKSAVPTVRVAEAVTQ